MKNSANQPTAVNEHGTLTMLERVLAYEVLRRPGRRSFSLTVTPQGGLRFLAPKRVPVATLLDFARARPRFVGNRLNELTHLAQARQAMQKLAPEGSWCALPPAWWHKAAKQLLPPQVEAWAAKVGVTVFNVRITSGQKVWGSCTSKGSINLSYRLLQVPPDLCAYVLLHEVCHRREMNHSARFWRLVGQWMPDYVAKRRALNKLGATLT
jgi:predicted metal-dependent hydrolase